MSEPSYRVEKFDDHPAVQRGLNNAAAEGWYPICYAIQSTDSRRAWHYVILARKPQPDTRQSSP